MPTEPRPVREIGPYTEGETPRPVTVFMDENPIDLTGFTVDGVSLSVDGTAQVFAGTAVFLDDSVGTVTLQLAAGDLTLPTGKTSVRCDLQIWTSDGTNTLATVVLFYYLNVAVGTKPVTSP